MGAATHLILGWKADRKAGNDRFVSMSEHRQDAATRRTGLRWYVVHAYSGMEKAVGGGQHHRSASTGRHAGASSATSWCRPKKVDGPE